VNAAQKRKFDREYGHYDIPKIRKSLLWVTPFCALLIAFSVWMFLRDLDLYRKVTIERPPVIRSGSLMGASLLLIPVCIAMWLGVFFRGLAWHRAADRVGVGLMVLLPVVIVGFLVAAFASFAVPLHYYGDYGYTECAEVRRASRIRGSVWLRDSKWCVAGRDIEWVNEQAAKEAAAKETAKP
jgi:hypothetical protein